MKLKSYLVCLVLTLLASVPLAAQEERVEEIPFGNMDQWIDRQIKESGIIGGYEACLCHRSYANHHGQ